MIVFILLTSNLRFAQSEQALDSLLDKVAELSDTDLVNAPLLANEIILKCGDNDDLLGIKADTYIELSKINHKLGNYSQALDHSLSAQVIYLGISNTRV